MIVEKQDWDDLAQYRESLEHFNIKGSSWYEHKRGKWQKHAKYAHGLDDPNKDDSKTTKSAVDKAKAKKEADTAKEKKKQAAAKEKAKKQEDANKAKAEKEAAKAEERRKKILASPTKLYKHRKEFTYDEIKKAMDTFKWEKELNGYSKDELQRGADFLKTLNTTMSNAINVYNTAARVVNSIKDFNGDSDFIPIIGDGKKSKDNTSDQNKQQNQQQPQQSQQQKQQSPKQTSQQNKTSQTQAKTAQIKAETALEKAKAELKQVKAEQKQAKAEQKQAKAEEKQAKKDAYQDYLREVREEYEEKKKKKK